MNLYIYVVKWLLNLFQIKGNFNVNEVNLPFCPHIINAIKTAENFVIEIIKYSCC